MINASKKREIFKENQERKKGRGLGGNLRFPSSANEQ